MTNQEIVVECFRLAERVQPTKVPSLRAVYRVAREYGARFTEATAKEWLSKFVEASERRLQASRRSAAASATHKRGSAAAAYAGAAKVLPSSEAVVATPEYSRADALEHSSVSTPSDAPAAAETSGAEPEMLEPPAASLDRSLPLIAVPPGGNAEVAQTRSSRRPRQPALALHADRDARAREILDAIWARVRDRVSGAMTSTAWRSRNKNAARELAELNRPLEDILQAHDVASEDRGEPVYMLAKLPKALLEIDEARAQSDASNKRHRSYAEIALADHYCVVTLTNAVRDGMDHGEAMRLAREAFQRDGGALTRSLIPGAQRCA